MSLGPKLFTMLAVAALFVAAVPARAVSFTFATFQAPGQTQTRASGINAQGQIAGTIYNSTGSLGFIDSNGTFTSVIAPGTGDIDTIGISYSGQVTGSLYDNSGSHGYIYTNGTFKILDAPDAAPFTGSEYGTHASGINDSGQVVGYYVDDMHVAHAYLYVNGTFTSLNAPGSSNGAFAEAINNAGQIVGLVNSAGVGPGTPFLYSDGAYTTIQTPNGAPFDPTGINDSGQIVGYNGSNGSFFLDTDGVFTTINGPGRTLGGPLGINDAGQIVGNFTNDNSEYFSFLATPVADTPEPSTLSLVGTVLLGLCWLGGSAISRSASKP